MDRKTPYIGRLDTKVTLYKSEMVRNSEGERLPTLVQVCETYASTDSNTGFLDVDEKVHHVVKSVFTIRTRPDVYGVPNLELHADGVKYRVHHVSKLKRSHLVIHCTDYD